MRDEHPVGSIHTSRDLYRVDPLRGPQRPNLNRQKVRLKYLLAKAGYLYTMCTRPGINGHVKGIMSPLAFPIRKIRGKPPFAYPTRRSSCIP